MTVPMKSSSVAAVTGEASFPAWHWDIRSVINELVAKMCWKWNADEDGI